MRRRIEREIKKMNDRSIATEKTNTAEKQKELKINNIETSRNKYTK